MAKKKVKDDSGEGTPEKATKTTKLKLEDLVGTNFVSARHIVDRKRVVIPFSPSLDLALGGGIREGSFVIVTGPPKVGKTTSILDFAATAQNPVYADKDVDPTGRDIYYFNIEGRINARDVCGIHHLDLNKFHVIQSAKGQILTAENYIQLGEQLINDKPGCIFIFDSFSQLCTQARYDSAMGDRFRDDTPLLIANFCKRISNIIPVNNAIVFGITHMIANQGGKPGQSPWSEASGRKIQYAADVKLKATHDTSWVESESQVGQDVHWICETSSLWNGPSESEVTSKIRYGHGLDKEAELIDIAADLGIMTKTDKGGWYTFPDDKKCQGLAKAKAYLVEQNLYQVIQTEVRQLLGLPPVAWPEKK